MAKTVIIIHKNKVVFRDESYMRRNYLGETVDQQVSDLLDSNNNFSHLAHKPTIIIQGKTVERILKIK